MTPLDLTPTQLRLARLASQRLAPECADDGASPARVVSDVCAIQAQDHPSALLGVCVRRQGLTAEEVEAARADDRSIVVAWLMRGTLHMVAAEDLGWMVALLGPLFESRMQWRLRQLELSEDDVERGVGVIVAALTDRGPLPRAELAEELVARGVLPDARGQRPAHLIAAAALRGLVCVGPMRGAKRSYALAADWLGERAALGNAAGAPLGRDAAVARLACRYLAAFGPATPADFAYWSGLPAGEARAGFATAGGELAEVRVEGATLWALPGSRAFTCAPSAPSGAVVKLPSWDSYLLGYADRGFALAPGLSAEVNPNGGVLLHARLEDGLVVGNWKADGS